MRTLTTMTDRVFASSLTGSRSSVQNEAAQITDCSEDLVLLWPRFFNIRRSGRTCLRSDEECSCPRNLRS